VEPGRLGEKAADDKQRRLGDGCGISIARASVSSRGLGRDSSITPRDWYVGLWQCTPKALITSGGRIHPESCRLIW
jgi:hypothetical protein